MWLIGEVYRQRHDTRADVLATLRIRAGHGGSRESPLLSGYFVHAPKWGWAACADESPPCIDPSKPSEATSVLSGLHVGYRRAA